ncbi:hypothetical protein BU17DRAFT_59352 [Hysterangium stoloniferum]|nr:hypothetical protein BU17DRAFT_59352 [Hysterangium stoloniferum]
MAIYPPDAICITNEFPFEFDQNSCPITNDMVKFLNLTSSNGSTFGAYFTAYCAVGPPNDDAPSKGPLVRISAYITNVLLATIIFHSDDIPNDAIWSQILTAYSLLITCAISINKKQLTRLHAILAVATAGSPSSAYIVAYAIRSIWQDSHRMKTVFGKNNILHRVTAIALLPIWMALAAYTMFPKHMSRFSQVSCEDTFQQKLFKGFFFLPFVLFASFEKEKGLIRSIIAGLPVELTVVSWFIAIWLSRRQIWIGERFKFQFQVVWHYVADNYPFILFLSVVVLPSLYWILVIEIGAVNSNDDTWEISFGQVLAMFVTIPPIIEVLGRARQCKKWFLDLAWVRLLTCQPQRPQRPRRLQRLPEFSTSSVSLAPLDPHGQRAVPYTEVSPEASLMEYHA